MTFQKGSTQLPGRIGMLLCLLLAGANASFTQETPWAPLTADQVVQKMVDRNEQRAQALESYSGTRIYLLEHKGLANKSATLTVAMTYRQPGEKKFCVISESGSAFLQGRVLKQLLEAEVEAMREDQRRQTSMNPENYEFRLVGYEQILDQDFYVLEVTPRIKNRFLFRGRVWVEGEDFAVAHMEVEPAKNPSWWTKRNDIHVTYGKFGEFWLPVRNETKTQVRIFGRSLLTIHYRDYRILNGSAGQMSPSSGNAPRCPGEVARLSNGRP